MPPDFRADPPTSSGFARVGLHTLEHIGTSHARGCRRCPPLKTKRHPVSPGQTGAVLNAYKTTEWRRSGRGHGGGGPILWQWATPDSPAPAMTHGPGAAHHHSNAQPIRSPDHLQPQRREAQSEEGQMWLHTRAQEVIGQEGGQVLGRSSLLVFFIQCLESHGQSPLARTCTARACGPAHADRCATECDRPKLVTKPQPPETVPTTTNDRTLMPMGADTWPAWTAARSSGLRRTEGVAGAWVPWSPVKKPMALTSGTKGHAAPQFPFPHPHAFALRMLLPPPLQLM